MVTSRTKSTRDYVCLSTDTKPTKGVANGSLCLEINTGKIYAFDESTSTWVSISGSGSAVPVS